MAQSQRARRAPSEKKPPKRVLAAAANLFAERGYAATTTRELADKVELERASLYHHIGSKEDLLYEICVSAVNDAQLVIEQAKEIADPVDRLRSFIVGHTTMMLRNRAQNVTMLLEMRALAEPRRSEIVRMRDGYESQVRGMIADAQAHGYVRTEKSAKLLSMALLNLLNWTLVWYKQDELSPEQLGNDYADIFFDGIVHRP